MTRIRDCSDDDGAGDRAAAESRALFVDDDELRRRINPKIGRDRFRAHIRLLEHEGFPRIHALFGGRYWPKVKAWLDKYNEVNNHDVGADAQDGQEHFDAPSRTRPGPQTRPAPAAVLDRQAGGPGSQGIPRRLHRLAPGR